MLGQDFDKSIEYFTLGIYPVDRAQGTHLGWPLSVVSVFLSFSTLVCIGQDLP